MQILVSTDIQATINLNLKNRHQIMLAVKGEDPLLNEYQQNTKSLNDVVRHCSHSSRDQ